MRVLLAIDGSASSGVACDLVASLPWPDGSVLRVISVAEDPAAALVGLPPVPVAYPDARDPDAEVDELLRAAAENVAADGRHVQTRRLHGRTASVIVEQAADLRAELIVVGSRGLGPLRTMLLGSVSAEVVDHAPCPVLVARADAVTGVLLAVDGSTHSQRAVEHLAGARYLAGQRVEVMSVGPTPRSDIRAFAPETATWADVPASAGVPPIDDNRRHVEAVAARAAGDLAGQGYDVRWSVAFGDVAHEIMCATDQLRCNLVVMGSRGLTGLDRIRLGSVARNVLLHSAASVLIVREPVRERVREPRLAPSGLSIAAFAAA